MEIPLLSQDEFFRHLELQSVNVVKFTYRQALKERLRSTTRYRDAKPTLGGGIKRTSSSSSVSKSTKSKPSKLRRIFGRTKRSESLEVQEKALEKHCSDRKKALGPLFKSMEDKLLPQLRQELDQYCSLDSGTISRSSSDSSLNNQVFVRKDYLNPRNKPTRYLPQRRPKKNCQYKSKNLIQHTSVPDQSSKERSRVKPGDFPLGPAPKLVASKTWVSESRVPPILSYNSYSKPDSKCSKDESCRKVTFKCRSCDKVLLSRSGLVYHEEHAHAVCKICHLWKKSKSHICDRCRTMFVQTKNPSQNSSSLANPSKHSIQHGEKHQIHVTPLSKLEAFCDQEKYRFKCDICSKKFSRRIKMIRHFMLHHSSQIHKVDLEKFVSHSHPLASTTSNLRNICYVSQDQPLVLQV